MVLRHSSITEAYTVLGLSQGASLDAVKTAYKQLALRTHPDKNRDNPDSTLQFQQVGEAYHLLLKHLDKSSPPPNGFPPSHSNSYSQFHHDGSEDDGDSDFDLYYDSDDEHYDEPEDLDFFMFLFEELLNGRANRYAGAQFQARARHRETETQEQYAARVKRQREEQAAATQRRKAQEEAWRARRHVERENEARAGVERRKQKAEAKKAEVDVARRAAAQKVRDQQQRVQSLRSVVFAAARCGDSDRVRKGIWEEGVDAAGGEAASGMDEFVQRMPKDPRQTLLHIATTHGDTALVEWLDRHNAEADERDNLGRTAFHIALQHGHIAIVRYFLDTYPPADADSATVLRGEPEPLLRLALKGGEPEIVWLILEAGLADASAARDVWTWVCTHQDEFGAIGKRGQGKLEEAKELLMSWGGFTPPSTPIGPIPPKDRGGKTTKPAPPPELPPTPHPSPPSSQNSPPMSPLPSFSSARGRGGPGGRGGRGRGRGRGRGGMRTAG